MKQRDGQMRILAPTAILGYGYPLDSFLAGLERKPHLIAVDAGSTDPGPYYLGSGKPFTDRTAVKRDLRYILREGVKSRVPVVIGSAGGCGARPHLEWCREILFEIAAEEKLSFRLGTIHTDLDRETVSRALAGGKIFDLPGVPPLTREIIEESVNIVAQVGVEPIINALKADCQVILCGRAYDPACFAALPILRGFRPGPAMHLGKILECAAIAAEPGSGSDSVLGTLYEEHFTLESLNPARKFSRTSTAAHSLYEKSDPFLLAGPGGRLNLGDTSYRDLPGGKVAVRGSTWEDIRPYRVKIEGARRTGYRTICLAGIREPRMIAQIDEILAETRRRVISGLDEGEKRARLFCHVYGRNGVMGSREPRKNEVGHEIALVISAVAPTPEEADTLCSLARSTLLHFGYKGRQTTAGNLAFPFSPSDIRTGEVFEFSIYHLMETDDPGRFPLETTILEPGVKK